MSLNPLKPVAHLVEAVTFPFQAAFIVILCYLVNQWTAPHHAWWHWAALGLGIAVLVKWAKALKALLGAALVGGLGYLAYRWLRRRRDTAARTVSTP